MVKNNAPKESFVYRQIKWCRGFLDRIAAFGILFSKEKRYKTKLGLFQRMGYWRKGFLSDSAIQYFGEEGDSKYRDFMSDSQRWMKVPVINAKYGIVLADKLMFNDYFDRFSEHLAPIFFYVRNNKLFTDKFVPQNIQDFLALMKVQKDVIIKPKSGYGGLGIFLFQYKDQQYWVNQEPIEEGKIESWLLSLHDYIVMEKIVQTGYAHKIFPQTVNTIRLVTMLDPITGEVHLGGAAQRFGGINTIPADNWTSGGLSAALDMETGMIGNCAINPKGKPLEWIEKHPDSGEQISGIEVPNWNSVCNKIKEIARFCHFCPYIGWDLVVNKEGFVILEANDSPDVHILQIHEPLIATEKNKSFFKHYGVI